MCKYLINNQSGVGLNPGPHAHRSVNYLLPTLGLNPSKHKLLTTIPPPTPNPLNVVLHFTSIEASKSKNTLRNHCVEQNNDFTRGETSNIKPWGVLRERTPKKGGGCMASAPTLDLIISLRGDFQCP